MADRAPDWLCPRTLRWVRRAMRAEAERIERMRVSRDYARTESAFKAGVLSAMEDMDFSLKTLATRAAKRKDKSDE